jgi:hypothetical protein
VTSYTLDFSRRHSYASQSGIAIPITLISDIDTQVDFSAKLDTGSTYCVFERRYADWLGLDPASGVATKIAIATGFFYCYGHELTLSVFDLEWQAVVYFAESEAFSINVVGRFGFLDRLRIGLVHYEQSIYLGMYDQL